MKKGIGTVATIIVVAVVLALATGTYFFVFKKDSVANAPIKLSLEDALKNSLGVDQINAISISNRTNTHVRGTYGAGGDVQDFYAVNNGGAWKIFQIESGKISCQRARALGFPESFIADCENTHPGSKTAKEVVDSGKDGDEVTVIGVINISGNLSGGATISSGGGEVLVSNVNNTFIKDGDVVVVSGTVGEEVQSEETQDSNDSSSDSSSSSNKTVIAETVDGFYDNEETTQETIDDSINEPQATEIPGGDPGSNIFDRDFSGQDILITP